MFTRGSFESDGSALLCHKSAKTLTHNPTAWEPFFEVVSDNALPSDLENRAKTNQSH